MSIELVSLHFSPPHIFFLQYLHKYFLPELSKQNHENKKKEGKFLIG